MAQSGQLAERFSVRGRESRLERGQVSECFIISNVAFPQALSKVSEQREPGLEMLNPLVTTWSKATLHFLIFALKREPHSGAFYLT